MRYYDHLWKQNKHRMDDPLFNTHGWAQTGIVVDISNVVKYLDQHNYEPEKIPAWLPPFRGFFESSFVARFMTADKRLRRFGVFADPFELSPDEGDPESNRTQIIQHLAGTDKRGIHYQYWEDNLPALADLPSTPKWSVSFSLYIDSPEFRTDQCVANARMILDEHGQRIPIREGRHIEGARGVDNQDIGDRTAIFSSPHIYLYWPVYMAIGFTHCKNVEIVDGSLPPDPLRKKQERNLGAPLVQFKELVIDPAAIQKRVIRSTANEDERKRLLSRHIVRGHFATYTQDRPRFGRADDGVGSFWISPHLRGSDDVGTVYKDYRVKP